LHTIAINKSNSNNLKKRDTYFYIIIENFYIIIEVENMIILIIKWNRVWIRFTLECKEI